MKRVKKIFAWVKKNLSVIITITLLATYTFMSYRAFVIQRQNYEVNRLAYQTALYVEELKHQNKCMDEILEILSENCECR